MLADDLQIGSLVSVIVVADTSVVIRDSLTSRCPRAYASKHPPPGALLRSAIGLDPGETLALAVEIHADAVVIGIVSSSQVCRLLPWRILDSSSVKPASDCDPLRPPKPASCAHWPQRRCGEVGNNSVLSRKGRISRFSETLHDLASLSRSCDAHHGRARPSLRPTEQRLSAALFFPSLPDVLLCCSCSTGCSPESAGSLSASPRTIRPPAPGKQRQLLRAN